MLRISLWCHGTISKSTLSPVLPWTLWPRLPWLFMILLRGLLLLFLIDMWWESSVAIHMWWESSIAIHIWWDINIWWEQSSGHSQIAGACFPIFPTHGGVGCSSNRKTAQCAIECVSEFSAFPAEHWSMDSRPQLWLRRIRWRGPEVHPTDTCGSQQQERTIDDGLARLDECPHDCA